MNRRNFLKTAALGAAAFSLPELFLSRRTFGESGQTLRVGLIGAGGRGEYLTSMFAATGGVKIAAICDPDSGRAVKVAKKYPEAAVYADLRKVLDDASIDAVIVATCNHWHVPAAVLAMKAGKNVYVEKPLCMTFAEGERLVGAVEKYRKICQVGTQMRSDIEFYDAAKKFLFEEKALGELRSVRINRFSPRPSIGKRAEPLAIPKTVDYNLWSGPADAAPLYRDRLQYDWHWMWRTGHGEMGNWGAHLIDDCRNLALRDSVSMPKRVLCGGARIGYNDAGETPNESFTLFDTGSIPVVLAISNLPDAKDKKSTGPCPGPTSGWVAYAEGGRFERWWGGAKAFDVEGRLLREFKGNGVPGGGGGAEPHIQNFIDAIRAADPLKLHAPATVGRDSAAWYNGANTAYRLGRPYSPADIKAADTPDGRLSEAVANLQTHLAAQGLALDAETCRVSAFLEIDEANKRFAGENEKAANALMEIAYRKEFPLPELD